MSLPPVDIPLGAMRFNSDSQKLEYWSGNAWFQIKTFSPNLDGGARGVFFGGAPSNNAAIDFITISTAGDAGDFGDMTSHRVQGAAGSSNTRGVYGNGEAPSITDRIEFITISTTGNATNFGDTIEAMQYPLGAVASPIRGVCAGGLQPSAINTIQDVSISTEGDAVDFGDLTSAKSEASGCSNAHGGL